MRRRGKGFRAWNVRAPRGRGVRCAVGPVRRLKRRYLCLCTCLVQECKVLVDAESGVIIPSAIKNHFTQLRVLNKWDGKNIFLRSLTRRWIKKVKSSKSLSK